MLDTLLKLLFLLFFYSISFGQSIQWEKADLSSSQSTIRIVEIGTSTSNHVVVLAEDGSLLLYNGKEFVHWQQEKLKNPSWVKSIHLMDSTLFLLIEEEWFVLNYDHNIPKKYAGKNDKLSLLNEFRKSRSHPLFNGENIEFKGNSILWKKPSGQMISNLQMSGVIESLIVDLWGDVWILVNQQLYHLSLQREQELTDKYQFLNQYPDKFLKRGKGVITSHGNVLLEWKDNSVQNLRFPGPSIYRIFDDENNLWVQDYSRNLYLLHRDNWFTWNENITRLKSDVVQIITQDDIVSIITQKQGIIQCRYRQNAEDFVFVPHRLNSKLKKLDPIWAGDASKEFPTFERPILIVDRIRGLIMVSRHLWTDIQMSPTRFPIKKVMKNEEQLIALDEGNRFYVTQLLADSIQLKAVPFDYEYPEINGNNFIIRDGNIIYLSKKGLVFLDFRTGSYIIDHEVQAEQLLLENRDQLLLFHENKYVEHLLAPKVFVPSGPALSSAFVSNRDGDKVFQLHPAIENNGVVFETEDLPLLFWAKANYLKDPQGIEYAWNVDNMVKKEFTYQNEWTYDREFKGEQAITLTLKYRDKEVVYDLPTMNMVTSIKVPDYRWAIYLSSLLFILLISLFLFYRWKGRQNDLKIERLELEKKAMEMEQKALQLQLNPHFIFNAMNGVKGMIAQGNDAKARQYLTKISSWMRGMLQDARKECIPISDEIEQLTKYVEIERELRGANWILDIEQLDIKGNEEIPPMMIQPFIENAIIHGFKLTRDGHRIKISFKRKGRKILVEIEDNGQGLKENKSAHDSIALKLIKERLEQLNEGTKHTIFELINKQGEETGVIVKLVLPIYN